MSTCGWGDIGYIVGVLGVVLYLWEARSRAKTLELYKILLLNTVPRSGQVWSQDGTSMHIVETTSEGIFWSWERPQTRVEFDTWLEWQERIKQCNVIFIGDKNNRD